MNSNNVGPREAMDFLRINDRTGTPEWSVALYWRGILTLEELGMTEDGAVQAIETLRSEVECWLIAS